MRYSIEEALVEGDSCLVILRITVPDKSIGKRERYHADIGLSTAEGVLMFPELTFDNDSGLPDDDGGDSDGTQPDEESVSTSLEIEAHGGRPAYAYMCFRFLHHPSMDGNGALISVYPRLETRRYIYVPPGGDAREVAAKHMSVAATPKPAAVHPARQPSRPGRQPRPVRAAILI